MEAEVSACSREIVVPGGAAETRAELGIPILATSPLRGGFFTGRFAKAEDIIEESGTTHMQWEKVAGRVDASRLAVSYSAFCQLSLHDRQPLRR